MKRTAKYEAAIRTASTVLEQSEFGKVRRDNAALYDALEKKGWFWDSETGKWADHKKSTSMFETDDSLPTGVFRLRLMAHPGDMGQLVEIINEALDTYGCQVVDQSNAYPNRRGVGERIYLTGKLPDEKDVE